MFRVWGLEFRVQEGEPDARREDHFAEARERHAQPRRLGTCLAKLHHARSLNRRHLPWDTSGYEPIAAAVFTCAEQHNATVEQKQYNNEDNEIGTLCFVRHVSSSVIRVSGSGP